MYPEQQIAATKMSWMTARADVPVNQEKVRMPRELVRWWHDRRHPAPPKPAKPPEDRL